MSEEAFSEVAYYDSVISNYMSRFNKNEFPKKKTISGNLIEKLRYGENPHQESAVYSSRKKLDIKLLIFDMFKLFASINLKFFFFLSILSASSSNPLETTTSKNFLFN